MKISKLLIHICVGASALTISASARADHKAMHGSFCSGGQYTNYHSSSWKDFWFTGTAVCPIVRDNNVGDLISMFPSMTGVYGCDPYNVSAFESSVDWIGGYLPPGTHLPLMDNSYLGWVCWTREGGNGFINTIEWNETAEASGANDKVIPGAACKRSNGDPLPYGATELSVSGTGTSSKRVYCPTVREDWDPDKLDDVWIRVTSTTNSGVNCRVEQRANSGSASDVIMKTSSANDTESLRFENFDATSNMHGYMVRCDLNRYKTLHGYRYRE